MPVVCMQAGLPLAGLSSQLRHFVRELEDSRALARQIGLSEPFEAALRAEGVRAITTPEAHRSPRVVLADVIADPSTYQNGDPT